MLSPTTPMSVRPSLSISKVTAAKGRPHWVSMRIRGTSSIRGLVCLWENPSWLASGRRDDVGDAVAVQVSQREVARSGIGGSRYPRLGKPWLVNRCEPCSRARRPAPDPACRCHLSPSSRCRRLLAARRQQESSACSETAHADVEEDRHFVMRRCPGLFRPRIRHGDIGSAVTASRQLPDCWFNRGRKGTSRRSGQHATPWLRNTRKIPPSWRSCCWSSQIGRPSPLRSAVVIAEGLGPTFCRSAPLGTSRFHR